MCSGCVPRELRSSLTLLTSYKRLSQKPTAAGARTGRESALEGVRKRKVGAGVGLALFVFHFRFLRATPASVSLSTALTAVGATTSCSLLHNNKFLHLINM